MAQVCLISWTNLTREMQAKHYWQLHSLEIGKLINAGSGQCVKNHYVIMNGDPVRLGECKETDIFTLSWHEDIAPGDGSKHAQNHCFDAEMDTTYDGVKAIAFWQCHGDFGNQLIKYLPKTKVISSFRNYVIGIFSIAP